VEREGHGGQVGRNGFGREVQWSIVLGEMGVVEEMCMEEERERKAWIMYGGCLILEKEGAPSFNVFWSIATVCTTAFKKII
jgi:hypothetical protein